MGPRQRHPGARRPPCIGAEDGSVREVIADLVWAHKESIGLVRTLLLSHELAVARQADADHSAALAAANPDDRRAKETAIEAGALAEAAHLTKLSATEEWVSYAMKLHGLLAMADVLHCDPGPAGGRAAPTITATAPARVRSRGDCIGRPGEPPRRAAQ